ncbi:MAG: RNA polymerase sigma factor [Clostridia bacterium]|nr:RNA polymerase sigma factor [Clostridia bacterium]
MKPVYGFALKRCRNLQDAEDLSQDIILKAFRVLLVRQDIADPAKFIWTIAHNALSNYYRDTTKTIVGVPADEMADCLADPDARADQTEPEDTISHLQQEIAYLSSLQRRIVIAYYYEKRKQADIAAELGIPVGTVKWHLFEAKKELKRGMETMRETSELKFNPIKFDSFGINGSAGTMNPKEYFRSALSQNICYCVRREGKTIPEIADALGVSPVYIESEMEFLETYRFLTENKGKYLLSFIISEPTASLLILQDQTYKRAAELFANALYDALTDSGILDDEAIFCNHVLPGSTREKPLRDKNFLLWALIPYIASFSGENQVEEKITFAEAATIRPDGGQNIFHASVEDRNMVLPDDYVHMRNWCGPMWNGNDKYILWQIDSEWSDRGELNGFQFAEDARRILSLYEHEKEWLLAKEDYAWLAERGYMEISGEYDGEFRTVWKIPVLVNRDIRNRLLDIGDTVREACKAELEEIKAPYHKAVLASVPPHLRRVREYELQYTFHADGWFLLHCITALLRNGRLQEPTPVQRRSLTTMIIPR